MRRQYADEYRGWPVAPKGRQHPVRGSFLDPRTAEKYHHGVDVSVRDDRPEPGAPPGRSHRVFALEGGRVWRAIEPRGPGKEGIVRAGHFGYGHVDPVVGEGDVVRPGQHIAWTVIGGWHVHVSEWIFPGGNREKRIPVNPLSREGKIAPFADVAPPQILDIRFMRPAEVATWRSALGRAVFSEPQGFPIDPDRLFGLVDVRARIEDPQSFRGWFREVPLLETSHHPARVRVRVTRLADGARILDRDVFRSDVTLDPEAGRAVVPLSNHYAPGTRQNLRAPTALKLGRSGRGELWFRLFALPTGAYWDTTLLANGRYRLTVTAWDLVGNRTSEAVEVGIRN
jgi:hypothetical protein